MSGILNNKTRIIDAILTYEGRRQMAEGSFSINYATFSDTHVVYEKDEVEGHTDPTKKIYLEAFNAPHDQIVFEADDSGLLMPPTNTFIFSKSGLFVSSGKLRELTNDYVVSGSFVEVPLSGSQFASRLEGILTSSIDNFKKLQIIGTMDRLFMDQDFALSANEIQFNINADRETVQMMYPTNVNMLDSLFNDEKLRNLINFRWLPPIKKTDDGSVDKTNSVELASRNLHLGTYPPWGKIDPLTFAEIKDELKNYERSSKTIYFDPTSRDNDILAQFFEIGDSEAKKLDVIDYGKVYDNSQNFKTSAHHVFFVGKLVSDDNGTDSFIHLFTLLFGSSEEE
jgi:hypothetical protein